MEQALLEIRDLSVRFQTPQGEVVAVDGLDLKIGHGETVGLVGESGCGKTVSALSILGLIPSPPGRVANGEIRYQGENLLELSREALRRIRGREIAMIFQEPMTSLNPVLTIGRQVAEPWMVHMGLPRIQALKQAAVWLDRVRIPASMKRLGDYPYQLSGGMRQRVMIAAALACGPKLLIADEPTTALDVTIQAQILSLIVQLKEEMGTAVLLITHDLGVVAQMTSRVVVMYAGEVVEEAGVIDLFDRPFHPYTRGLLRSIPRIGRTRSGSRERLVEIPGTVPALTEGIIGCKFKDRCVHAFSLCHQSRPRLFEIREGQRARCWLKEHPGRRREDG